MHRKIVATVAFGADEYLICAELMFRSLRKTGWNDECICFSDREWAFPEDLNVQTVVLPHSPSMKCNAFNSLNLEEGDIFIFADSDMLFLKNPEELSEIKDGSIYVCQNGLPLKIFDFNKSYLTQEEIKEIPITQGCINTGLVIIPGGQVGIEFCEKWTSFHSSVRGTFEEAEINIIKDQPALEALMLRNEVKVEKFPHDYMFFPALVRNRKHSKNCVVLHFTGYPYDVLGKNRLIEAMKRTLVKI